MIARSAIFIVIFSLFLTGCYGQKNIQDLTYVVAFGIDYDDKKDEMRIIALALDFTNVAKQEGAKSLPPPPEWIGEGKGKTVEEAISKLYEDSQPDLFLQHVKAIIITENALTHKFKEINESVGRSNFFRFSVFMFSTNESLDDIFKTKALFFYPQIFTVYIKPRKEEGESNMLSPKSYREFLSEYFEPVGATYLPSLGIYHNAWVQDNKKYPLVQINGAHFFENQNYQGHLSIHDIQGMKWENEEKKKKTYILENPSQKRTVVRISTSNLTIHTTDPTKPSFQLRVKGTAEILENVNNLSEKEIENKMEKLIREEIKNTYVNGLKIHSDLFRLGTNWFRFYKEDYQKFTRKHPGNYYLKKDSLQDIKVTVHIRTSDNYKSKTHSKIYDTKSIYGK
ncbi:Ger(x)C family spore germination protein [Bacillus sp. FJAT-29814]|uniref:Ger(x)C family spore germination protein n=1 Tax=Bacillus sp. FJAT-29814 TaxID=1729688 RepID=UPI000830050D|nr:Ger(x)C family spore germination protein [Bacillus sp. FJAT-29814]